MTDSTKPPRTLRRALSSRDKLLIAIATGRSLRSVERWGAGEKVNDASAEMFEASVRGLLAAKSEAKS